MTAGGLAAEAWRLEWRLAARRRRLLVLNVVVPLVLVAPVALGGAPPQHAAVVYAVLVTLFGTFGSAIPLVRDAGDGLLGRLALAGMPPRSLVVGRTAAGAAIDLLELAPAAALIALAHGGGPVVFLRVLLAFAAALVTANALGVLTAAVGRSIAETALLSSVAALLLLHASGAFRTPRPGSPAAAVERLAPFRDLHETLLAATAGAAGAVRAPELAALLWPAAALLAVAALAGALARGW